MKAPVFLDYIQTIRSYNSNSGVLPEELCISRGPNGLSTWYAPFEHINESARLVICGITPGWQQADKAILAAKSALMNGETASGALRLAKNTGSFAGVMRSNLTKMLNHIGVNEWLNLSSCDLLFGGRSDLVHYTSALRYPVFKDGANYSGSAAMVKEPYLWRQSSQFLGEEIRALPEAVWLPLGSSTVSVFERLVREGYLNSEKVLFGMPHASGANAERIKYFLGEKPKDQLSIKVNPEIIETGRYNLLAKVAGMRAAHNL